MNYLKFNERCSRRVLLRVRKVERVHAREKYIINIFRMILIPFAWEFLNLSLMYTKIFLETLLNISLLHKKYFLEINLQFSQHLFYYEIKWRYSFRFRLIYYSTRHRLRNINPFSRIFKLLKKFRIHVFICWVKQYIKWNLYKYFYFILRSTMFHQAISEITSNIIFFSRWYWNFINCVFLFILNS